MPIPDDNLLDILACPVCKTAVLEHHGQIVCCNIECRRIYEVRDDIPVMLIEESAVMDIGEWERVMAHHMDPTKPTAAGSDEEESI
jgi:uncharacterized protein YbaR (Trm112 family)